MTRDCIREDFPALTNSVRGRPLVYLDNAATTQTPRCVIDRMNECYLGMNGNIHRGIHSPGEQAAAAYEAARESVRRFINASSANEIIFTPGATASINLVADSFRKMAIGEGDDVVITEVEHHSNVIPWQVACEQRGATLKVLPLGDDGRLRLELLSDILTDRTRLVGVTHVSNVTGMANPIAEITARAHAQGVPVLVDGAQSVQHTGIDVQRLDCDFFAFSGHKMYAGFGVGVLYGKEAWLERMPPWQTGGGMVSSVALDKTAFAPIPHKFEAGTPNIVGAIGLGRAIEYLKAIGMADIERHESALMAYAERRLSSIDGITLYGAGPRLGALSFNLADIACYDACVLLDKMGIALRSGTHCAEPAMRRFGIDGAIRASVACYNTLDEIDMLADGLTTAREMLAP